MDMEWGRMRFKFVWLIVFLSAFLFIFLILGFSTVRTNDARAESPTVVGISFSAQTIRAGGDPLRIRVDAEDFEDPEWNLTIEDVEWQYNGASGGDRTGIWSGTWFGNPGYDNGGGFLFVPFQIDNDTTPGYYGFRVKVTDTDGNKSDPWEEVFDAVKVVPIYPDIEYVAPEKDEVYRGTQMTVRMKGSDAFDSQDELTPHLEFRRKGTNSWTVFDGTPFFNSAGEYWEMYWTPETTLELGQYEFRGGFENTANAFSDYMDGDSDVAVMNNVPEALDIGVVGSNTSVFRTETITLYAHGEDVEDSENQLTAYFEYEAPGDTWDNAYFSGKTYNEANDHWEIDFEPHGDAALGDYSFRVYFRDEDDSISDTWEMSDAVAVNNVVPVAEDLTNAFSALRGQTITIIANGFDRDGSEETLVPTFQLRPPIGAWMDVPAPATFIGGLWRLTWVTRMDDEAGQYAFRVRFSDGVDVSDWLVGNRTCTLENNQPSVLIQPPGGGGSTITFLIHAGDEEDTEFEMTYEWDFGDGSTSREPFPTHEFTEPGSYTVTVTVTDSDGDIDTDTWFVTIPEDAFPFRGPPDSVRYPLLAAFLVTVVITVLLAFIVFKRQEEKGKRAP